jgi:hypothetical protein
MAKTLVDLTRDVPGPIRSWRAWQWSYMKQSLMSYNEHVAWPAGEVMRAECRAPSIWGTGNVEQHLPPGEGCTCGLYSLRRPPVPMWGTPSYSAMLIGVVDSWGKVVVHEDGYRSEFARPRFIVAKPATALTYRGTEDTGHFVTMKPGPPTVAEHAAARAYDLPLVKPASATVFISDRDTALMITPLEIYAIAWTAYLKEVEL